MNALALIVGPERTVAPALYRFTVKCDRDRNAAIERAARKAGLSVNEFVQRHFDGILDVGSPAAPGAPAAPARNAAAVRLAACLRNEVTEAMDQVWRAMARLADDDGQLACTQLVIAEEAGRSPASACRAVETLVARGLIEIVRESSGPRPAVYRVAVMPGAAA